ncbi:MAG TPA: hypothetical protein EYH12_00690 [Psychromonas hadalis]|nr:hypothetical protein [Psychromonas hadalis]
MNNLKNEQLEIMMTAYFKKITILILLSIPFVLMAKTMPVNVVHSTSLEDRSKVRTVNLQSLATAQGKSIHDYLMTQFNNKIPSGGFSAGDENIFEWFSNSGDGESYNFSASFSKNNWASQFDFTGVAWNGNPRDGGNWYRTTAGILVTNQYILIANHFPREVGDEVWFTKKDGSMVKRTIVSTRQQLVSSVPGVTIKDAAIQKLDRPINDVGIKVYPIFTGVENTNKLIGAPLLTTDQRKNLYVADVKKFNSNNTLVYYDVNSSVPNNLQHRSIMGDSGSPQFMIANNELVVVATLFNNEDGLMINDFYGPSVMNDALQVAIEALDGKETSFDNETESIYVNPTDLYANFWFADPSKAPKYVSDLGVMDASGRDIKGMISSMGYEETPDQGWLYRVHFKAGTPLELNNKITMKWNDINPIDVIYDNEAKSTYVSPTDLYANFWFSDPNEAPMMVSEVGIIDASGRDIKGMIISMGYEETPDQGWLYRVHFKAGTPLELNNDIIMKWDDFNPTDVPYDNEAKSIYVSPTNLYANFWFADPSQAPKYVSDLGVMDASGRDIKGMITSMSCEETADDASLCRVHFKAGTPLELNKKITMKWNNY